MPGTRGFFIGVAPRVVAAVNPTSTEKGGIHDEPKNESKTLGWRGPLICGSSWAAGPPSWLDSSRQSIGVSMNEVGAAPGDRNLLVLTNAGYGSIESQSTEAFLDAAQQVTGCSFGTRSLLALHTSLQEPLWWALYRKDTGNWSSPNGRARISRGR